MVSRALDVFTKIILSTEEEDARMTMTGTHLVASPAHIDLFKLLYDDLPVTVCVHTQVSSQHYT